MTKPSLRSALQSGAFVAAPGIHDMLAAVVSNKVGFDFVYASGYWMTASAFGLPDAGIASYTQMLYVVPSLAICLAAASAMGLLVVAVRSLRRPPGAGP